MEYPFKDLLPLEEVLEREGYYKDWTHLDPKIFYSLTQISEYIKTKGYGVDVRLLIAQLAEHFGLKTTQVVELADLLQQKFTNLEGVTQSFTNNINSLVAQMEADKDAVIANATVDSEVILARGGKATLGERLDDTTAQLAQTDNKVKDIVSILDYGADPTGNADSSTAIEQALLDSNVVVIPDGTFKITQTIKLTKGKKLNGNGKNTIIKPTSSFNILEFDVDSKASNLTIDTQTTPTFNAHVFEVSNNTLTSSAFSGSSNCRVVIDDIDVFTRDSGIKSAIFAIFMEDGIDGVNSGFYGVDVKNINHIGYGTGTQFFMKNYCKGTNWITGLTFNNIVNHGTVWGFFDGENDDDLNDPTITSNADKVFIHNYQHQSRTFTKAYAYIRNGEKSFSSSVAWDWHGAVGDFKNRPFLLHSKLNESVKITGIKNNFSHIMLLETDNTLYKLQPNDIHIYERYVNEGDYNKQIIFGASNLPATRDDNDVKALLLYKGTRLKRTREELLFYFRTNNLRKWIEICVYPTTDTTVLEYQSSHPLPYGYGIKWRTKDNDTEVYLCKTDNTRMSLYDVIKTEPISNSSSSYSSNGSFTNYYVTARNPDGVYLSTLDGLTDVNPYVSE